MTDIVDSATRSRMMAGIRSANTRPELMIRKALHAAGFRYRLHSRSVPGKPDMAFVRYRAVIFIHGCFWHGHDCALFRLPKTRRDFWALKIGNNRRRDAEVRRQLASQGWRTLTIWECSIRGRTAPGLARVVRTASAWLRKGSADLEIRGP